MNVRYMCSAIFEHMDDLDPVGVKIQNICKILINSSFNNMSI